MILKLFFPVVFLFLVGTVTATEISQIPVESKVFVKPNMIFGLDDSGSMDSEVLMNTNDGAMWWNRTAKSFLDGDGNISFNDKGGTGSDGSHYWYKYVYLFPNGKSSGARTYGDSTKDHYAIAPTAAYAYMRSSDYNPIYYNSNVTYKPWAPASISGSQITFPNSNPSSARSHPIYPTSGTVPKMNLTANQTSTSSNHTFRMFAGSVIPGADISGVKRKKNGSGSWSNITSNFTIPEGDYYDVMIPYYPATFYVKDATCTSGANCFTAYDGAKLRRYEIKPGNTFPSGRSYDEEIQNFANWFTYYRKRKLMMAAAMGKVLEKTKGMRGGYVRFNSRQSVIMYDFDDEDHTKNWQALLGLIYKNPASGGTPMRETLNYIGLQFEGNSNVIKYACQVNASMILTDGYANAANVSVPSYSRSTYGGEAPYSPITNSSLSDIALAYYTRNLRSDLPSGLVGFDPNNAAVNADKNPNLHMVTYAMTIGPLGTIFGTNSASATNPFSSPPNWPAPTQNRNPTAIDDLWHATINGRGLMLNANEVESVASALQKIIADVFIKAGAGSAVGISNVYVRDDDNTLYIASYSQSYGNLAAYTINFLSGVVSSQATWSAQALLDNRDPDTRVIATYDGQGGVPFRWSDLTSDLKSKFATTTSPSGDVALFNWFRGLQDDTTAAFRSRVHKLGDIVYAEPVSVGKSLWKYTSPDYASFIAATASRTAVVYQAANDGMLHAFNAKTGQELWAYVPSMILQHVNEYASADYMHRFLVDGTPAVGDVKISNSWKTILVGGLRAGGHGFYALDVTNPADASNEAGLAAKVLWEFPNDASSTSVSNNIGLSFGKPVIVKTKAAGWVVLVTSGYNNYDGDGKGHLFVLDAATGALIKDIPTTAGSSSDPSGLAHISAYAENGAFDPLIEQVYGGDLEGNVWRFDLSGDNVSEWNVKKLATLVDASGVAQPITTELELANVHGKRFVLVGTGKMLAVQDVTNTKTQSFYALIDDLTPNPTISTLRTRLVQRTVSGNAIVGNTADYATKRGWYIDFPGSGERLNYRPSIALGILFFNTNKPSPDACVSESYIYMLDLYSGLTVAADAFGQETPWARRYNGKRLTSNPKIIVLKNNKVLSVSHNSDNTLTVLDVPSSGSRTVKSVSWKEIYRD